jgi:hypothetical protein
VIELPSGFFATGTLRSLMPLVMSCSQPLATMVKPWRWSRPSPWLPGAMPVFPPMLKLLIRLLPRFTTS